MPSKSKPQDLYTQFFPFELELATSDSSDLVEDAHGTGLSIRGTYIWLIHAIEWLPMFNEPTSVQMLLSLSKLKGESTIPGVMDNGCIGEARTLSGVATSGAITQWVPFLQRFLPPIPFAAPNISLYGKTLTDSANWRGVAMRARLHYTTVPIDPDVYVEIAETWAFS